MVEQAEGSPCHDLLAGDGGGILENQVERDVFCVVFPASRGAVVDVPGVAARSKRAGTQLVATSGFQCVGVALDLEHVVSSHRYDGGGGARRRHAVVAGAGVEAHHERRRRCVHTTCVDGVLASATDLYLSFGIRP